MKKGYTRERDHSRGALYFSRDLFVNVAREKGMRNRRTTVNGMTKWTHTTLRAK